MEAFEQRRIMITLETVELVLGDLPGVASEWEQLSDVQRMAWGLDWSDEMSGLEDLAAHAAGGKLAPNQLEARPKTGCSEVGKWRDERPAG